MGAYDCNGDNGCAGVAREYEAPPLEGGYFLTPGPHAFREYHKGHPRPDFFPSSMERPDGAARMVPVHPNVAALS